MASLQKVAQTSRHILVIGILSIVGISLLVTAINIFSNLHPAPVPPPTVAFGKLPPILFPDSVSKAKLHFTLDTLSGSLSNFGDRATIYKMVQSQPTLTALTNTTALVTRMGYTTAPIKISDSLYQWTNTDALAKTLRMDIFSNNFAITSSYTTNQDVVQGNNLVDQNNAIDMATLFLQNATLLPTDIDSNKTKATLLSLSGGQLVNATSFSATQIIQVDFFQKDVHTLPIFYPQPTHSTMSMFIGGGTTSSQIILANFNHQSISDQSATYPIITTQQAFDLLQKGQGYIASYNGADTNISIRNIVLGYYMSDVEQQYLEPILVFEGSNGFFAYVPVVKSEWIRN